MNSKAMHILADENIPGLESLWADGACITRLPGREIQPADVAHADALFVRSVTRVDQQLLQGSAVRFVGTATSGTDHVDVSYLADRGIGFCHAPGSNANSVVEYVLASIAAVDSYLESLFDGGTVGIVGYGHIGRLLVERLTALGINCKVFDPWLEWESIKFPADLEEILECEVVTLHCELTEQAPWPSYHLLGPVQLRELRSDSLLINASRGPVIDNLALFRHLSEQDTNRVVLDVWESEPDINDRLLEAVTLGSAHIAGYSLDGKLLATRMLVEAASEYFNTDANLQSEIPGFEMTLTEPNSGAQLVRQLLSASYDILYDDALLRGAVLGAGAVEVRENFDQLRKHYRTRRELRGSVVRTAALAPSDLQLLNALGCVHQLEAS